MERGALVLSQLAGCVCVAYLLNRGQQGAPWEVDKPWRRRCDVLGNVLLKLWFWHYFDTYHPPEHCCRPFLATAFPNRSGSFRQDSAQYFVEWFVEHDKEPQILVRSVGCARESIPIHGDPASQLTGLKVPAANALLQIPQHTFRVHPSMDHSRFGGMRRTYTILDRCF